MNLFPQSVKNTLWSYDTDQLDIKKDKNLIIFSVLNWGTKDAVMWLYKIYSKDDIKKVIKESNTQNWSYKSLNYWTSFLDVQPIHKKRFL